jgi:hypothetical protein
VRFDARGIRLNLGQATKTELKTLLYRIPEDRDPRSAAHVLDFRRAAVHVKDQRLRVAIRGAEDDGPRFRGTVAHGCDGDRTERPLTIVNAPL